jgi:inosine-uridine nucleoside N-ribohydrolase
LGDSSVPTCFVIDSHIGSLSHTSLLTVLSSFTDLARAIEKKNSVVDKIGTVFLSGGVFNLTGIAQNASFPYYTKNKNTG